MSGKVYLVLEEYEYECCCKLGIFSSEEKAENFVQQCGRNRRRSKLKDRRRWESLKIDCSGDPPIKTAREYEDDFTIQSFVLDKGKFYE